MANLVPNQNSFIGFLAAAAGKPFGTTTNAAPTLAEINAAVDFTDFVVSLTANSSGNAVPTPRLKSLFETSIPGTSSATFSADMYRDDQTDTAWTTLTRGLKGTWIVQYFGGTGPNGRPAAGQITEVWPTQIISRAAAALQSGAAMTFTVTASVPIQPNEAYTVPTV